MNEKNESFEIKSTDFEQSIVEKRKNTTEKEWIRNGEKKRKCVECGKALGFFEGFCHPVLGKHTIICHACYLRVEVSVERWGRFVLWNSFNPEAPDPTYLDTYPFPREETDDLQKKQRHRKDFRFLL